MQTKCSTTEINTCISRNLKPNHLLNINIYSALLPDIYMINRYIVMMQDLSFHDQEDITSIGEQGGTTEFDILPVRTR